MIIYVATNTVNGKQYVGQTINTLEKRIIGHKTKAKTGCSTMIFYSALRKYGFDSFTWEIVEGCTNIESLNEAEEMWIEKLNTLAPNGYNLRTGGLNYEVTEIMRKNLSDAHKGKKLSVEHRAKISESNKGKIHTEESKKKMSASMKGKYAGKDSWHYGKLSAMLGRKHSEETKKKMSKAALGNKSRTGMKDSEETRRRKSEAGKRRYQDPRERKKTSEAMKKK